MIDQDLILNSLTEAVLVILPNSKIIYHNKAAESLNAIARTKLQMSNTYFDFLPEKHHDFQRFLLDGINQNPLLKTIQSEFSDETGKISHYEITYKPIIKGNNELKYILMLFRDITFQKVYERKTSDLLKEFTQLIEHANAVIIALDGRGYITEWNKECIRLTGFEKNDVLARRVAEFVDPNYLEIFTKQLDACYAGTEIRNLEISIKTTKEPATILISLTPKINQAGQVIGILLVGYDITELSVYRTGLEKEVEDRTKKLVAALEKEKELVNIRNKFVSIASHEFRVPLKSINGWLNILRSNDNPDTRQQHLEKIQQSVFQMTETLDGILEIGKTQRILSRKEKVNLTAFLKRVVEEVSTASQSSHQIILNAADSVIINSDERLLRNIFINLISNAVKFSPGKDRVIVNLISNGSTIDVQIQDFGIGIPADEIPLIFESFKRASNAEQISGTGLGLSIVKKAVEALEGNVSVVSKINEGTTYTVTLNA